MTPLSKFLVVAGFLPSSLAAFVEPPQPEEFFGGITARIVGMLDSEYDRAIKAPNATGSVVTSGLKFSNSSSAPFSNQSHPDKWSFNISVTADTKLFNKTSNSTSDLTATITLIGLNGPIPQSNNVTIIGDVCPTVFKVTSEKLPDAAQDDDGSCDKVFPPDCIAAWRSASLRDTRICGGGGKIPQSCHDAVGSISGGSAISMGPYSINEPSGFYGSRSPLQKPGNLSNFDQAVRTIWPVVLKTTVDSKGRGVNDFELVCLRAGKIAPGSQTSTPAPSPPTSNPPATTTTDVPSSADSTFAPMQALVALIVGVIALAAF